MMAMRSSKRLKPIAQLSAVGMAMALAVACSQEEAGTAISESDYGEAWPFTVSDGRLRCEGAGMVVFRASDIDYAVNGLAGSKYAPIEPIWRLDNNPAHAGLTVRINIGPIIERGLALCQQR